MLPVHQRSILESDHGIAVVELAVSAPILIILAVIVTNIGILLRDAQTALYAAREGARIVSMNSVGVPGQQCNELEKQAKVVTEKMIANSGLPVSDWDVRGSIKDMTGSRNTLVGAPLYQLISIELQYRGLPVISFGAIGTIQPTVKTTFSLFGVCE